MIAAQALTELISNQRWFGDKGLQILGAEVLDEAVIDDGPPELAVALVRLSLSDGTSPIYHLPLLLDGTNVVDAFTDVDRLRVFGRLMCQGHSIKGNKGIFHFGGPGLDPMSPPGSRRAHHGERTEQHFAGAR